MIYRIGHPSRRCCPTLIKHPISSTFGTKLQLLQRQRPSIFKILYAPNIQNRNFSLCYTVHHSASLTIQLYPGENLWQRGSATRTNSIFRLNSLWVQFTHIVVPYMSVCVQSSSHGLSFSVSIPGISVACCTDKKGNKIFLINKDIQRGSGAKSYV